MRSARQGRTCARCGRTFGDLQIRKCPNEAVNRVLGEYICHNCCKRCYFRSEEPLCGAIRCCYHDTRN